MKIEPLLKSQLDPIARRKRGWKRAKALAIGWAFLACLGLALLAGRSWLGNGARLAWPAFVGVSVLVTFLVWRRHGRWQPDYRNIAREIERTQPDLHAL